MRGRVSPATIIATVALFFSLAGAGMAATGYRITSIWQIAPKVRHELRGRAGPPGVQGPMGPQGPQGAAGPTGESAPNLNATGSAFTYYSVTAGADLCPTAVDSPDFSCAPTADFVARCKLGDYVVSGGFQGTGDVVSASGLVSADGGELGRGWHVAAHLDQGQTAGSVSATLLCARPN